MKNPGTQPHLREKRNTLQGEGKKRKPFCVAVYDIEKAEGNSPLMGGRGIYRPNGLRKISWGGDEHASKKKELAPRMRNSYDKKEGEGSRSGANDGKGLPRDKNNRTTEKGGGGLVLNFQKKASWCVKKRETSRHRPLKKLQAMQKGEER